MGKLLINKRLIKSDKEVKSKKISIDNDNGLYKPLSDFKWKDASQTELHQNSIKAYTKNYAF